MAELKESRWEKKGELTLRNFNGEERSFQVTAFIIMKPKKTGLQITMEFAESGIDLSEDISPNDIDWFHAADKNNGRLYFWETDWKLKEGK